MKNQVTNRCHAQTAACNMARILAHAPIGQKKSRDRSAAVMKIRATARWSSHGTRLFVWPPFGQLSLSAKDGRTPESGPAGPDG